MEVSLGMEGRCGVYLDRIDRMKDGLTGVEVEEKESV
jgi:hypothetical protein